MILSKWIYQTYIILHFRFSSFSRTPFFLDFFFLWERQERKRSLSWFAESVTASLSETWDRPVDTPVCLDGLKGSCECNILPAIVAVQCARVCGFHFSASPSQSSGGAVWKSRWTSWVHVPNKPTVSVDVEQHSTKVQAPVSPLRTLDTNLMVACSRVGPHWVKLEALSCALGHDNPPVAVCCERRLYYSSQWRLFPLSVLTHGISECLATLKTLQFDTRGAP